MRFLGILSCFCSSDLTETIPEEYGRPFSLAELREETNNFDESSIIRDTGSAKVYKGHLAMANGSESCGEKTTKRIAIKRFYQPSYLRSVLEENYKSEVKLLCQLHHPNIVPLVGYCTDSGEKMIVYEYMEHGLLHDHLHGVAGTEPLSWKRRLEICRGAACGLHHLHSGAKYAVIHGDIKSRNILLDKNWDPKIADFGLSVRGPLSMSKEPIGIEDYRIAGTVGYLAPEYVIHGKFSEKSDVYSFGMLLLEVLLAKRPTDILEMLLGSNNNAGVIDSVGAIARRARLENTGGILDPFLEGKVSPASLVRYLSITERCLDDESINRPAMGEVEVELDHALKLQWSSDGFPT